MMNLSKLTRQSRSRDFHSAFFSSSPVHRASLVARCLQHRAIPADHNYRFNLLTSIIALLPTNGLVETLPFAAGPGVNLDFVNRRGQGSHKKQGHARLVAQQFGGD
jgi:hypothetical protein